MSKGITIIETYTVVKLLLTSLFVQYSRTECKNSVFDVYISDPFLGKNIFWKQLKKTEKQSKSYHALTVVSYIRDNNSILDSNL